MASLLWFRKGLRLHDNPALHELLLRSSGSSPSHSKLLPVFVLDPWFVSSGRVGAHRMRFLLESLQDLDQQLRGLSSRLLVYRGDPLQVLPELIDKYGIQHLAFEKDTEPYAKTRSHFSGQTRLSR